MTLLHSKLSGAMHVGTNAAGLHCCSAKGLQEEVKRAGICCGRKRPQCQQHNWHVLKLTARLLLCSALSMQTGMWRAKSG